MDAKALHDLLEQYGNLKNDEEIARMGDDFARVSTCQNEIDRIETSVTEQGFTIHYDEGYGIWTLGLRDQINPEW